MRAEHAQYLVDPITKEALQLEIEQQEGKHIMTGSLKSSQHRYPILNGIPRLLPEDDTQNAAFKAHQQKTGDSFAYEWNNIYEENDFEKNNFLHFLSPFVKEEDLAGKDLLDVGCGSGRFTKQAALCGAKLVIGTDHGESVEVAFKLTRDLPNACVVQADVYHMPLQEFADLTFSIGVLHHLPEPEKGFQQLPDTVKPGGQLLIWVYNRRKNFRAVYVFETMRKVTRHLPPRLLYRAGYVPAAGVHALNTVTHAFNRVGATRLAEKIPFSYYANFPFSMKVNDAFDVFATPKSNYYYVEEIEKWFEHNRLRGVRTHEHPEAGITAIGTVEVNAER